MTTSGMHRRPFEGRHLLLFWIILKQPRKIPSIPTDTPVLTPHVTSAHLPGQRSPPLGEQPSLVGDHIFCWYDQSLARNCSSEWGRKRWAQTCRCASQEAWREGGATPCRGPVAAEEQSAGGGSKCLRKKRRQRIPASEGWGGGGAKNPPRIST